VSRIILTLLIVCGLLDATAIANVSNFGIGAYVAADAVALVYLAWRGIAEGWYQISLKRDTLRYAFVLIALMWLFAALQNWFEVTDTWRVTTQTTLRSLLIVHFLVCTLVIQVVDDRRLLVRIVMLFLALFICYGLYDFVAQIFGYPRFLDALRNNHSLNINRGVGSQGWVFLPRLSSLAAEPSHTAMHVLLAFYLATQIRKRSLRFGLMFLAFAFCIGTFARTIWIAVAGATVGTSIVYALVHGNDKLKRTAGILVAGGGALLPIAVLLVPLMTGLSADADASVLARFDSSRAGILMFAQHPLLGMGLHGWDNHPLHAIVDRIVASPGDLRDVLNGVAVYLAALGVAGLLVVYMPLVFIMRSRTTVVAKIWWVCAYSLTLLGGDYIALASTWTAIAIVTAPTNAAPAKEPAPVAMSASPR
jgi:hypothetical protein